MSSANPNPQRWFPLESNPELLNKYISNLGFDTSLYKFYDVFSTEDWAVSMVPQPVIAVLMLYPITKAQEAHREEERKELFDGKDKDKSTENDNDDANDVWFTKQRIGNACGTIGILHALANIPHTIKEFAIPPTSWLGQFYKDTTSTNMDPIAKAERLEMDTTIAEKHDVATSGTENQTSRGSIDDKVETHFVALVNVNGQIYELDGRKEGPINHGKTTDAAFLTDACKVVEKFMKRDPDDVRFTITALGPSQVEE